MHHTDATAMPRARMKVRAEAFPHAAELLAHLLEDGRTMLGADPGASYQEVVSGHHLVAFRLACGGVEVRQITRGILPTEGIPQ